MKSNHCDRLKLLSFVAGDLTKPDETAVISHLQTCTACTAYVQSIREERRCFLDEYPEAVIADVRQKNDHIVFWRPLLTLAASIVLAIGAGVFFIDRTPDTTHLKGGEELRLFVNDSTGFPAVRPSSVFSPGERIQFTYSCGTRRYFILTSIDETGRISTYYPLMGDSSMVLETGANLPLPNSIILDSYIGKELFIAVFSARPLQVAAVIAVIRRAFTQGEDLRTAIPEIKNAAITSILLVKKERQR